VQILNATDMSQLNKLIEEYAALDEVEGRAKLAEFLETNQKETTRLEALRARREEAEARKEQVSE
jgi:hypothetical protein